MAAKNGEKSIHIIKRWNRAVREGIGYLELLKENREREAKKRLRNIIESVWK